MTPETANRRSGARQAARSPVAIAHGNAQGMRRGGLRRLDRAIVVLQEILAARSEGIDRDGDFEQLELLLREARLHFGRGLQGEIEELADAHVRPARDSAAE